MYLLDTNICIDFVDARNAVVKERVRTGFPAGLSVSTITAAELLVGPRDSEDPRGDRERAEQFLRVIGVIDFDQTAASAYSSLVQRVGMKGRSFDRLIAAHALSLGKVLVTSNLNHFADVPGLKVENWGVL